MAHKLKIAVEDMLQSVNYIRIIDWSDYDTRMAVTNRVLKVEAPGEESFKLITLPQAGSISLTSKSLKLSKELIALNDGLWVFTYSICPNERLYNKVYHFRTVALHNKIMGFAAKVMCSQTDKEVLMCLVNCLCSIHALKANSINEYNIQKAYDLYKETERAFGNLYSVV